MSRAPLALGLVVLLLGAALGLGLLVPGPARGASLGALASTAPPLKGTISGPTILSTGASSRYLLNASGGPAELPNGTTKGNITYFASVSGSDLTGVTFQPASAVILPGVPGRPTLSVGNVSEVLTLNVEFTSVLGSANDSVNQSYTVNVVVPYTLSTTLYNPTNTTVLAFTTWVYLDGVGVGNVSVPNILPHSTYPFSFKYPSLGLGAGTHTFTVSLTSEHGLLTFPGGASTYSQSFYVPGPAANYTVWYVAGIVTFFGVLFIFGARVGARRRGAAKK